jgi:hypothetical protein
MAYHFGTDLGTTSGPCGAAFYIGKLGYGRTTSHDWHLGASADVYAFPVWNVTGPHSKPSSLTYGEWGSHQADKFWSDYSGGPPTGKWGKTLFGSIDTSGYAGTGFTIAHARSVLTGFYNRLNTLTSGLSYTYGIYGGESEYISRIGAASWTPPQKLVVWEAHYYSGSPPACATIETDMATYATTKVGTYKTMIWQYSGTPDYDLTSYDGGPVSGKWNAVT